jgi:hypothetical protein
MKKVIGLFAIALSLISCTAEEVPSELMIHEPITVVDWDCSGIDPHARATVIRYDYDKKVNDTLHYDNIKKHTELSLKIGDRLEVIITSGSDKGIQPNPYTKLYIAYKGSNFLHILEDYKEYGINGHGTEVIIK